MNDGQSATLHTVSCNDVPMKDVKTRDALVVILTLVTGITDAIGFTRLGGVFTSVMTGNMVLLGISAAKEDGAVAIHTAIAFAGYVIGSFAGARISPHSSNKAHLWPRTMTRALIAEFVVFGVFAVVWETTGQAPSGHLQLLLLGTNALALGIQSAAVIRLGVSGLSTTYLTGTLTTVVVNFTTTGRLKGQGRSSAILIALIAGAALGALGAIHVPVFAPIIQEGTLAIVIVVGWWAFREANAIAIPDEIVVVDASAS